MLSALFAILVSAWLFMALMTWVVFLSHKVDKFNNNMKYKLTLGAIYSIIGWPWLLWETITKGEL